MQTGSFTITPDSTTTAWPTSIPSNCTWAMASIGADYGLARGQIQVLVDSAQAVSGTLTVNVFQTSSGSSGYYPVDSSTASTITINYIVA